MGNWRGEGLRGNPYLGTGAVMCLLAAAVGAGLGLRLLLPHIGDLLRSGPTDPPFFDSSASGGARISLLPMLGASGEARAAVVRQATVDYSDWGTGLELDVEDPLIGRLVRRQEERLAPKGVFEGAAVLALAAGGTGDGSGWEALLIGRSGERQVVFAWLDLAKPFKKPRLVSYSADVELCGAWMRVGQVTALAGGDGGVEVWLELIPWTHLRAEPRWIAVELAVEQGRWRPGAWRWVALPTDRARIVPVPVRQAELPRSQLALGHSPVRSTLFELGHGGVLRELDASAPVVLVDGRAEIEERLADETLRRRVQLSAFPAAPDGSTAGVRRPTFEDRLNQSLGDGERAWVLRPLDVDEPEVLLVALEGAFRAVLLDAPTPPGPWAIDRERSLYVDGWPWANAIAGEPVWLWRSRHSRLQPDALPRWWSAAELPPDGAPNSAGGEGRRD